MGSTKVLVVDDSAVVRELLTSRLSMVDDIEVVATAPDAYIARRHIVNLRPDVITLDIEMPRMDGLTFLRYLMKSYPMPVIIVSSLLEGDNRLAMEAMEAGAVDLVPKPGGPFSVEEVIDLLATKIRAAATVNFSTLRSIIRSGERRSSRPEAGSRVFSRFKATKKLIAVGASTGGTVALERLFRAFGSDMPPVLAVIHMPQGFTKAFADRLNALCEVRVKEAEAGEALRDGTVYIAPGNDHMELHGRGTDMIVRLHREAKVHNCRPSVDVLFHSVAEAMGANTCAVILTGMGRDGAEGLKAIKDRGGYTIAQDEESSIVFGMPKEAIDIGAAHDVCSLDTIADRIREHLLHGR